MLVGITRSGVRDAVKLVGTDINVDPVTRIVGKSDSDPTDAADEVLHWGVRSKGEGAEYIG